MRHESFASPLPVGPEREQLRTKGQFWTPAWVARGMVAWAVQGAEALFDPAVGPGAFFDAGKYVGQLREASVKLKGAEINGELIAAGIAGGLSPDDYAAVVHGNYMNLEFSDLPCIVANPPYIRHHRMLADEKLRYQENSSRIIGRKIDGCAGLHVHFLIKWADSVFVANTTASLKGLRWFDGSSEKTADGGGPYDHRAAAA